MSDTIPQATIDDLNMRAEKLIVWGGEEDIEAYYKVAQRAGLIFVRYTGGDPQMIGTTDGPQCKVYRDANGRLVNLWIAGDSLGFDDQVE